MKITKDDFDAEIAIFGRFYNVIQIRYLQKYA